MSRRTRTKLLRFTTAELEVVTGRARACGMPVAAYIRSMALGGTPKARPGHVERAAIHALGRVGLDLQELAGQHRDHPTAEILLALRDRVIATARSLE